MAKKPKPLFGKKMIAIRLDNALLDFFRKSGRGWQSRINQILKDWVEKQK